VHDVKWAGVIAGILRYQTATTNAGRSCCFYVDISAGPDQVSGNKQLSRCCCLRGNFLKNRRQQKS